MKQLIIEMNGILLTKRNFKNGLHLSDTHHTQFSGTGHYYFHPFGEKAKAIRELRKGLLKKEFEKKMKSTIFDEKIPINEHDCFLYVWRDEKNPRQALIRFFDSILVPIFINKKVKHNVIINGFDYSILSPPNVLFYDANRNRPIHWKEYGYHDYIEAYEDNERRKMLYYKVVDFMQNNGLWIDKKEEKKFENKYPCILSIGKQYKKI